MAYKYQKNYSKPYRRSVAKLQPLINRDEELCIYLLQQNNWYYEQSVNDFYEREWKYPPRAPPIDEKKLANEFIKLMDKKTKQIEGESFSNFQQAIGLQIDSVEMIVFTYVCKCKKACVIKQEEYLTSMKKLGFQTHQELKNGMQKVRDVIKTPEGFRKVYTWAYDYYLTYEGLDPSCIKLKKLDWDFGKIIQDIFFKDAQRFPLYKRFSDFLNERKAKDEESKPPKTNFQNDLARDNYLMVFEFFEEIRKGIDGQFSTYVMGGEMPILIEDFQEYLNGITGLVMEEGENEDYEPIYKIKL